MSDCKNVYLHTYTVKCLMLKLKSLKNHKKCILQKKYIVFFSILYLQ